MRVIVIPVSRYRLTVVQERRPDRRRCGFTGRSGIVPPALFTGTGRGNFYMKNPILASYCLHSNTTFLYGAYSAWDLAYSIIFLAASALKGKLVWTWKVPWKYVFLRFEVVSDKLNRFKRDSLNNEIIWFNHLKRRIYEHEFRNYHSRFDIRG